MSLENYIPKEATQQREFLLKYPEYDGRGIKIAIVDSDIVDKSLPGMQKTTTGLPKIIHWFGEPESTVDTSTVVGRNKKNFIFGLSDRKLNIPKKWKNPSDEWHLGSVPFRLIYNISVEDENFEGLKKENANEKYIRPNSLKDEIIDCVVWFDGEKWRACIDTSFYLTGFSNLRKADVLTDFSDGREFAYLINKCIYCVSILKDGNSLQIFHPLQNHGTSVSHVAAAYFPDEDENGNGLAPGAQIISISARDWKNIKPTLLKCIENKVDIVNISLSVSLTQTIGETLKEMVEEHGIIICQSASNNGPFYSSIPGVYWQISEHVFIIGSVFTEEMKSKLRIEESLNLPFVSHFSSKGPFPSGARGVHFVAPGFAVSDQPKWNPSDKTWNGGTSFAAPNVAGSIACLLSALKANKIPYSPAMIRFALANTAFLPKGADKLAFGNGIIQISDAFEFIKKSYQYLPMKSLVPMNELKQNGIFYVYDKSKNDNSNDYVFGVNIDPKVDAKWILKCTSNNKNFVNYSKTLLDDNSFNVKIKTKLLKEGKINYTEIQGFDPGNPSLGPFFYLPITVIYPADVNYFNGKIITVNPCQSIQFFIRVPFESPQRCNIEITLLKETSDKEIIMEFRQDQFILRNEKISSKVLLKFSSTVKKGTEGAQHNYAPEYLFDVSLIAKLPQKYPDVLPELSLEGLTEGLNEEANNNLLQELNSIAEQNLGMPMVYAVASELTDKLEKLVKKTANDKMDAEMDARRKEEEQAFKEYEADKVTVESFAAWRKEFEEEMRPFKEAMKKALKAKTEGRLTVFPDEDENGNGLAPGAQYIRPNSLKDEIIDCVVWFDGEKWRACIDTSFYLTGFSNLRKADVLTDFSDGREFAYLINKCIYCVSILKDGNSLQIFHPLQNHGTSVSHVAAAYFPDEDENGNGLAPGAQIISISARDWKNIKPTLLKCIENKVDIVNISLSVSLTQTIGETLKEMVEEHGIIICQSASNNGPFYSSIPGVYWQISEHVFIIGSVFTEEMKSKLRIEESLNLPFVSHFSSKGPFPSGARGVHFVAPGFAVSDQPKWNPSDKTWNGGTSFAAPNVAGSIACLLSALKANKIPYSPAMIRFALANTAFLPKGADKLAFGNGIIQISDAFEFIKKSYQYLPMKSLVPMNELKQNGIFYVYDKSKNDNSNDYVFGVNIDPKVDAKWILKCTSNNKNFVNYSKTLLDDNSFNVKIKTKLLKEGKINYTEIQGFDPGNPSLGPFFYLPITVIYPADVNYFNGKIITVNPCQSIQFFIRVPFESPQRCNIEITLLKETSDKEIIMEFRQDQFILRNEKISSKVLLKFSSTVKKGTVRYDIEEFVEYFQLCVYHKYMSILNFTMKINFVELFP